MNETMLVRVSSYTTHTHKNENEENEVQKT